MKSTLLRACACALLLASPTLPKAARYLFVWAGDAEGKQSDFLAVLDVTPQNPTYGRIVGSVAAGAVATIPHHTEYSMPESGFLFANGFRSGKSFIFDVRNPLRMKLVRAFDAIDGYMHPHSFVRLPNGHVLVTFSMKHGERGGGLVELDNDGRVVRAVSAVRLLRSRCPHSALQHCRAAGSRPHPVHQLSYALPHGPGVAVQVWTMSDLKLLRTIRLSPGSRGYGHEDTGTEGAGGWKTVLVQTRSCGLHRITGLESDEPRSESVYTFEGGLCGVPLVVDHYWIEAVPAMGGVVVLDVSNPAKPVKYQRSPSGRTSLPTGWHGMRPTAGSFSIPGAPTANCHASIRPQLRQAHRGRGLPEREFLTPGIQHDQPRPPQRIPGGRAPARSGVFSLSSKALGLWARRRSASKATRPGGAMKKRRACARRFQLPLLGSNQDSPDPESGVLPVTPRGSNLDHFSCHGAEGDRTPDLCIANAALSQLSYRPQREYCRRSPAGAVN